MTNPPTNLDGIEAKVAELRQRIDRKNPWPSDNESFWTTEGWKSGTRNALDKLHVELLLAEVRRLRAELAEQQDDLDLLEALRAYGVDNWDGYDEAAQAAGSV
ncbi:MULTISPECIES: hypothetical protein [unclassified Streptomyces]|uniref:hypothetical protein n=1 Tax=unclassified Streptomyces TaxID=2593676 RepID=UPI0036EC4A6A